MTADRADRLPLVFAANFPGLATHIGWGFLMYQAQRKRGVRAFRRELLRAGMTRDRAGRLAQAYHDLGSVRQMFRSRR